MIISQINNKGRCKRGVLESTMGGESRRDREKESAKERGRENKRSSERERASGTTRSLTLVHARTNAYAQAPTSQLVKNSCGRNVSTKRTIWRRVKRPPRENAADVFVSRRLTRYSREFSPAIAGNKCRLSRRLLFSISEPAIRYVHAHIYNVGYRVLEKKKTRCTSFGVDSRKTGGRQDFF